MLIGEPLPFIKNYIEKLNEAIKAYCPENELSRIQRCWLSFCVTAIIVTNSVCWSRFQKVGIGQYSISALSWMFRKSSIPWEMLLQMSVAAILRQYGITKGCIGIDDTDKKRSKSTRKISYVHKIKHKPSGGYVMGQSIVFLVLITPKITIPVGFAFHMPDPGLKAWSKNNKKLKEKGVPKKERPAKPDRDKNYPTMPQIAVSLLEKFRKAHPQIHIQCVFADALYGTKDFVDQTSTLFKGAQVISQIRENQLVRFRNRNRTVKDYFEAFPGTEQTMQVRGGEQIKVAVGSARLHIHAHGKKRFVIALKYEGEDEYRYIIASDLSWRTIDIMEAYTLRWLVGVSRKGRIIQSVKVRPRLIDSRPRSLEGAVARKQDGKALRQHSLKGGCATYQVVTYSERRCSLVTRNPVAETVDNVRRQQEMAVMGHIRCFSPAGYQRRHGMKDNAETGEALDARRRNFDEELRPITLSGKWRKWRQGGGSGCSTVDLCAAKRTGREGPGPVVIPCWQSEARVQ